MSAETAILAAIARHDAVAIAVSGGVDSMLLAHLAHRTPAAVRIVHAVSFAVPKEATDRVKAHASTHGWDLALVDAGELADPQYTANPVNRCYFCKSNLYTRIRSVTDATIASGANVDDLGDFRPGLLAAAERSVVHPFVEAGAGKAVIYALAAELGLGDIAALPAQPCLASRIETGIVVTPETLTFIDETERTLRPLLGEGASLRCRVTAAGVAVEVAPTPAPAAASAAHNAAATICASAGRPFLGLKPYQRGSAFLTETA